MAKKQKRHRHRESADVVRGPSRTRLAGERIVNPFDIPAPKGANPGPIKRSTAWKPRLVDQSEGDPEEAAAFAPRVGDVMPVDRRNRRVSGAALEAAQRRMAGTRIEDDSDENDEADEEGSESEDQEEPEAEPDESRQQADEAVQLWEAVQFRPDPPYVAPVPAKARTPHPSEQYEQPQTTQSPSTVRKTGVEIHSNGVMTHPSGLMLMKVTVKCVDSLWDWIRGDEDLGKSFLGAPITTSLALHQYIQYIAKAEESATSIIRSLYWNDGGHGQHLGFIMLAPILANERTALMHVYLEKSVRGGLGKMIAPLVDMAEAFAPGLHLAVWSSDDVWARLHRRLLEPLGFTPRVMFIR